MRSPNSGPSGRSNRKRGQAMVEFALVIPIFLLTFAAIADFGFALFQRMTIINAARDGARAAVVVTNHATITTVAQQAATSSAAGGLVTLGSTPSVTCLATSVSVSSPATIGCSSAVVGDSVSVTVSYTYHTFFPLLLGATFNLSATVQMVIDS